MKNLFKSVLALLAIGEAAMAASVELTWDPSLDPAVRGYAIHVKSLSDESTRSIDCGPLPHAYIDDLQDGASYAFTVSAYDNYGVHSDPSEPILYSVPTDPNAITYSLNFSSFANGLVSVYPPSSLGVAKEKYLAGTIVTLTAAPRAGYIFGGWTVNGQTFSRNPISVEMDAEVQVSAVFSPLPGTTPAPSKPLEMTTQNGQPVLQVSGEMGAWIAEASTDFKEWVQIASGPTSQKVPLSGEEPFSFFRLRAVSAADLAN